MTTAAAAAKSLQSCPTLCHPMDCSLPGSSVHGIFQARVLEWVAIAFSEYDYRSILILKMTKGRGYPLLTCNFISFVSLSSISTSLYCLCQYICWYNVKKENYFNVHQKLWEEKFKKLKGWILLCLHHHHHPSTIVLNVISLIRFPGKQMPETKYGSRKIPVECSWDKTLLEKERNQDGWSGRGLPCNVNRKLNCSHGKL